MSALARVGDSESDDLRRRIWTLKLIPGGTLVVTLPKRSRARILSQLGVPASVVTTSSGIRASHVSTTMGPGSHTTVSGEPRTCFSPMVTNILWRPLWSHR